MNKKKEIEWLKGLIEKYPMTIYLQEEIENHIKEVNHGTGNNKL